MRLTPLDIRHKEFSRAMRGYKDLEVDEFLDDIADEFERVFNENIDYEEQVEALGEKIEQYKNIEETLKKTLLSAQQQAEELKHNAKKESDLILRDAELKSRSVLNDCYAERQKVQRSVQALKQKHEDLRYQLRSVLETYANILDQEGDIGAAVDEPLDVTGIGMTGADMTGAGVSAAPGVAAPGTSNAASAAAPGMHDIEAPPGPERMDIESLPADEPLIIDEPPSIDEPVITDEPAINGEPAITAESAITDEPPAVGDDAAGDDFIIEGGEDSSAESTPARSFDIDEYFGSALVEEDVSIDEEEPAGDGEAEAEPQPNEIAEDEPAAGGAAGDEVDEDPFVDAESDTDDREFKW